MENKAFIGVDLRSSAALNEFFRILLEGFDQVYQAERRGGYNC
jgi:hypothetical protein